MFGCLGSLLSRAVLIVMYLNGYLAAAYETVMWPLLGFVFLPLTTIFYAWTMNTRGEVEGLYTVGLTLAVLADLGVLSGARDSE